MFALSAEFILENNEPVGMTKVLLIDLFKCKLVIKVLCCILSLTLSDCNIITESFQH